MEAISLFLDEFMRATAWPMERPAAYGPFHLIFTVVGFTLCYLLARKLRHASDRQNRVILLSVGIFLMLTEVYKQLFHYYYICDHSYAWWIFPFQLCSVPMYLCVIAPLLKKGRVQKALYSFMMCYNLLGGFMAFIEPSGILQDYWVVTLHSCVWHMVLVFVGLYIAFSGRGGLENRDYKDATKVFLMLCVVAFSINLICWEPSGHDINMFFIGPKNSSLIVFKQISEWFGWYVSTALYIPTVCLGAYLILLPFRMLKKKLDKTETTLQTTTE